MTGISVAEAGSGGQEAVVWVRRERLDQLNERFSRYLAEQGALAAKLARDADFQVLDLTDLHFFRQANWQYLLVTAIRGCRTERSRLRASRLLDLQQRLLPALHRQITAAEMQL